VQVDEVKSLHDFGDKLKNLITNDTSNYEKKGKDTIVVKNLTNLIFTSNNENALSVPADDRRFVLFRCKPIYKGNMDYFHSLGRHLEQAEVAAGFYQFLMGRDLSIYPYDFQSSRPITEYYKESQLSSIPVIARFFSAKVNSGNLDKITAADLYSQYAAFHTKGTYKFIQTNTAFGRDITRIDGVKRIKGTYANSYVMDGSMIKQHLIKSNGYDPEALLD
jgi:phage/plasmid-associated DNA primase